MKYILLFLLLHSPFHAHAQSQTIETPKGIFSSHVSHQISKYIHEDHVSGALVRVKWSDIEPQEGQFDFTAIERQRQPIINAEKQWSLAVIAGSHVPSWMLNKTNERMEITFRRANKQIIPFWSETYQTSATLLAKAIAKRYGKDPKLVLIYIPQQTANGIEGHFNGNKTASLIKQGLTEENWVGAAKKSIDSFTKAFPNKAIAIELHELLDSVKIPQSIIRYIEYNHRKQVGIGVWWLSGKTTYQTDLLRVLQETNLPIYAQVIGKSSQTNRFKNAEYNQVFHQANIIGAQYVEVWNYELEKRVDPSVTNAIIQFSKQ